MPELCRRCDVFIGSDAVGVAKRPAMSAAGRPLTLWDYQNRCWICLRTRDEIRAAGQLARVP